MFGARKSACKNPNEVFFVRDFQMVYRNLEI